MRMTDQEREEAIKKQAYDKGYKDGYRDRALVEYEEHYKKYELASPYGKRKSKTGWKRKTD